MNSNILIPYSIPVTSTRGNVGETPVYRNPGAVGGLLSRVSRFPEISNLQELHDHCSKMYADLKCLGTRVKQPDGTLGEYQFKDYKTVAEISRKAGSAILNMNLAPLVTSKGDPDTKPIVIYARNSEEWVFLDLASCYYGLSVVPIFDTLGLDSLQFIFGQTCATTIFIGRENLDALVKYINDGELSIITTVVSLAAYNTTHKESLAKKNVQLISWVELLKHGEKILPFPKVTSDTVFTLGYTSGTTGNPKAAILKHGNLLAVVAASEVQPGTNVDSIKVGDVHLSYLPIAHIFERQSMHTSLSRGLTIGFFGGDILKLKEDIQLLKPSYLISVPRLYNKFYEGIEAVLSKLPRPANMSGSESESETERSLRILKSLPPTILNQLKLSMGGKIKYFVSGSAPISPHVIQFLRMAFGAPIVEGYGQTETCGVGFAQRPEDLSAGNVGGPNLSVEVKLVDLPEMNYTSKDKGLNGESMPRGEICLRGPIVFKGYYKEPEITRETIDEEGWHHTGDVGEILPNGSLRLIDRKKNIIKLAQGEFVAPEKIENVYLTHKYVAEIFVHCDSFHTNTVAVVVPDRDNLLALARELGVGDKSFEEVCKDPQVVMRVLADLNRAGRDAKLLGFELIQNIHLEPISMVMYGLMTPSMKLKRNAAKEHFKDILVRLYQAPKAKL